MAVHGVASQLLQSVTHPAVVKRSIAMMQDGAEKPDPINYQLHPLGFLFMVIIGLAFAVSLFCVRYTCWGVISTLAFVEKEKVESEINIQDTSPPSYQDVAAEEQHPSSRSLATGPVTASLRQALRHLRAIGGWRSYFRGFVCFIAYHVAFAVLSRIIAQVFYLLAFNHAWILAEVVGGLAASVALIQVSTAWTHIVISEPSPKGWSRRLPPLRRTIKNVWLVTLVNEVCVRISILAPAAIAFASGLVQDATLVGSVGATLGKSIGIMLLGMALFIVLVIPSSIALSRVQASMLPEEDETIVPFDRSFGGKVEPAIVGGSGSLKFVDAWKTIEPAARARVLKLFAKIFIIEFVMHVTFGIALAIVLLTSSKQVSHEGST